MPIWRVKYDGEYITMPLSTDELFKFFFPTKENLLAYYNDGNERTHTLEDLEDEKVYKTLLRYYKDGFDLIMDGVNKRFEETRYEYDGEVYEIICQHYYNKEGELDVSKVFDTLTYYIHNESTTPAYELLFLIEGEIKRLRDIEKMYKI